MKLIKITNDHYVVVDDSEIEENDWCCNIQRPYIKQCQDFDVIYYNKRNDLFKKITHSTLPLEQMKQPNKEICIGNFMKGQSKIQPLSIQEVKELIGEVDVEKKAFEYTSVSQAHRRGFIDGYNQALEDNKEKKYTERDLWRAFDSGKAGKLAVEFYETLLQHKTEWEIEEIDGKFKLK